MDSTLAALGIPLHYRDHSGHHAYDQIICPIVWVAAVWGELISRCCIIIIKNTNAKGPLQHTLLLTVGHSCFLPLILLSAKSPAAIRISPSTKSVNLCCFQTQSYIAPSKPSTGQQTARQAAQVQLLHFRVLQNLLQDQLVSCHEHRPLYCTKDKKTPSNSTNSLCCFHGCIINTN